MIKGIAELTISFSKQIKSVFAEDSEYMVTAIYSLSHVHGAELWLLFWAICLVAYFGICMIIKQNRTKHGIKNVLIGMLVAEVLIDLIWAIIYYHNGTYLNYGIGAVYGLLLLIPILVITLIIVSSQNKKSER